MSNKTKRLENYARWETDKAALLEDGYELRQLASNGSHYRVECDWSPVKVDIWPGTRKMGPMTTNDYREYFDIQREIASCLAAYTWGWGAEELSNPTKKSTPARMSLSDFEEQYGKLS